MGKRKVKPKDFYLKPKYNTKRLREEEKIRHERELSHLEYLVNAEERWIIPHKCPCCGHSVKRVVSMNLRGCKGYSEEKFSFSRGDDIIYFADDPYKDMGSFEWLCEKCNRRFYPKFIIVLMKIIRFCIRRD